MTQDEKLRFILIMSAIVAALAVHRFIVPSAPAEPHPSSLTARMPSAVPHVPHRFWDLGDQVLKSRPNAQLLLGQIDRSLPQAGKVSLRKILRRIGGQDFQREVFREGSDQLGFGFGLCGPVGLIRIPGDGLGLRIPGLLSSG